MELKDAMKMMHGNVVDVVKFTAKSIYNQKSFDTQHGKLVVQDCDSAEGVKIKFMNLACLKDMRGKTFECISAPDNKGKVTGVKVSKNTGKDGKVYESIEINRFALINIDGKSINSEPKKEVANGNDTTPPKTDSIKQAIREVLEEYGFTKQAKETGSDDHIPF